jgi:hypothetical protein
VCTPLSVPVQNVDLKMDRENFINLAASAADQVPQANFSQVSHEF